MCVMGLFNNRAVNWNNPFKIPEVIIKGDSKTTAKRNTYEEKKELKKLNLKEIIKVEFPDNQYYRIQTPKKQIVLHHTVSGQGVDGDIAWWRSTEARIATHVIIDWEGKIYQCFSSKYWGHHLGVKSSFITKMGTKVSNKILNQQAIGIEIDAWGGLIKKNGLWYPAKWDEIEKKFVANTKAGFVKNITEYPNKFRGFSAFESYTPEQIEAVRQLLVFWGETYDISLEYQEDMWDVSTNALNGKNGVWTHTSFRDDKSDCHPQKELVDMLKSL